MFASVNVRAEEMCPWSLKVTGSWQQAVLIDLWCSDWVASGSAGRGPATANARTSVSCGVVGRLCFCVSAWL